MWIRIKDISVKQIEANHLENPKNSRDPMVLNLFQREGGTVFFISKNKKVFPQYIDTSTGRRIPKRKWTEKMKVFAQEELEKIPSQKGRFKVTILGWIFLLLAVGAIGHLTYKGLQAPAKAKKYQQEMTEKATVEQNDIYFGRYRIYREKGNFIGSKGGFGWFKVMSIENDIYHIVKSIEMSDTAKPKEELNNSDFEEESFVVKAKELGAYRKVFTSEDGLIEIYFSEKKE